jgi:hypothetical protein
MKDTLEWMKSPEGKASIEKWAEEERKIEEILTARIEQFHTKYHDKLDAVIERLQAKYNSDGYRNKEYKMGYEPRETLLWFLFEYATRYCEPCEDEEYFNTFTGSAYYLGSYVMQVIYGQGSALLIDKQTHPKKPRGIQVNLDKEDLVNLVMGTSPYYNEFENPQIKQCGSYTGGMTERWDWKTTELEKLSEEKLYELYLICKNSWK